MIELQLICATLTSINNLVIEVVKTQTPEQAKILWDRHIELTAPFYAMIGKINAVFQPVVSNVSKG